MEYLQKVCPCCNDVFETTKTNKKYCDSVCKNRHAPTLRESAKPKFKDFVQYNTENNISPLPGDCVRLTRDYGNLKSDTLGIITGIVAEKKEEYEITFNSILPPYINVNKALKCEGGTTLKIKKNNLLHVGEINMLFCYPDRKKADDLFLVNNYKVLI